MWRIEQSSIGRIAVPSFVPSGFAVFCSSGDFPGRIDETIAGTITAAVRERFGVAASLTSCNQVHGTTTRRGRRGTSWRECDACDALWSDERQVALAIKIADCLPVTLIDAGHQVIANVHSGWRGAEQGVTAETLETLARETAFEAESAWAYLGPSIRVCCFEVGEEVAPRFAPSYVDRGRSKPHVDLVRLTRDLLLEHGVAAERISDSELCTRCEGSIFHSYRRDSSGGRNLAVVAQ